jgi:hypothetical protein
MGSVQKMINGCGRGSLSRDQCRMGINGIDGEKDF